MYYLTGSKEMSDKLSKGIGTSVYSSPEQQNQRVYDSKVKSSHLYGKIYSDYG